MYIKYKLNIITLIISSIHFLSFPISEVSDSGKLYPTNVNIVTYPTTNEELQQIVKIAHEKSKKISIAGARYSQGGQSNATDSINIDLTHFNKLIKVDFVNKTATVQSGMTWKQLQEILHPLNLSIKVMQSSNVFSIGGSISANVHGRDLHYGPIIETINSCKIINSIGEIQSINRQDNFELFSLVVGGYGLFGIITEIELSLTDNPLCFKKQETIAYEKYIDHFKNNILPNHNINLYYGRFVMIPGKDFLKKIISVSHIVESDIHHKAKTKPLKNEKSIISNQWFFNQYRKNPNIINSWLRYIIETRFQAPWETGNITCRNQLMRPYIHSLENKSKKSTDLLQEYFIPLSDFTRFTNDLRQFSSLHKINLLNVTLRFVPKNTESFLSYTKSDMISFVLYFTTNIDTESLKTVKVYTTELTNACLRCDGTFYLPYQQFASSEEMHTSYPMMKDFIQKKKLYDPKEIFVNNWYNNYLITL